MKWQNPSLFRERGEFERVAREKNISLLRLLAIAWLNGKMVLLSELQWRTLENTNSWETVTMELAELCNSKKVPPRDINRIRRASRANCIPAPIIMEHRGKLTLVAGDTRLMVARATGVRPRVFIFHL